MLRFLVFIGLIFGVFTSTLFITIPCFLYYLLRYTGFELVVLAILIDGYLGAFYGIPWLTMSVAGMWFLTDALKRVLLLYTREHEIIS